MNLINDLAELFELVDENGNVITGFYATVTLDNSGIICEQCFGFNDNTIRRKCNGEMYSINVSGREFLVYFPGYFYPFASKSKTLDISIYTGMTEKAIETIKKLDEKSLEGLNAFLEGIANK